MAEVESEADQSPLSALTIDAPPPAAQRMAQEELLCPAADEAGHPGGHIGLAIGMLPQRLRFADVFDKWRKGEEQPPVSVSPGTWCSSPSVRSAYRSSASA